MTEDEQMLLAAAFVAGAQRNDRGKIEFTDQQLLAFISVCIASCVEQLKQETVLK